MVRASHRSVLSILVLLTLLASTAGVLAQTGDLMEVEGPSGERFTPARGEPVNLTYRIASTSDQTSFVVTSTEVPRGWMATISPSVLSLPPGATETIQVMLEPGEEAVAGRVTVEFDALERNGTGHQVETRTVEIEPQAPPKILGLIDNPLPAPLDNAYGAFVLSMFLWIGIGVLVYAAQSPLMKIVGGTGRTSEMMRNLLRGPFFGLIFVWGLDQSINILPPFPLVRWVGTFLDVVLIVMGLYALFRLVQTALVYYRRKVAPLTTTDWDDLLAPLIEKGGAAVLIGVGFFLVLQTLNVNIGFLLAAGGFAGIIIGLAAQDTIGNFLSGLYILVDRPFREGDDIQLETGEVARVEKIGLRTTRLYHYRMHEIFIVPNNDLATKRVINLLYPDRMYRWNIDVGVAYGSDVDLVKRLLTQAVDDHDETVVDDEHEIRVLFREHGDSALLFTVRFFITDARERWRIGAEVRERIDELFREHGVNIPFPQRTHWFRSPLSLDEFGGQLSEGADWQLAERAGDEGPEEDEGTPAGAP